MRIALACLALAACATPPRVYRMERAQTVFVVADPGSVDRAYRAAGGTVNDYGFPGVARAWSQMKDGLCEVWVSWRAEARDVLHEMAHCEGKWSRMQVAEAF